MSLKTRYNLWKTRKSLGPEAGFRSDLWKKLDARWAGQYKTDYLWYQTLFFKRAVAVAIVVFAMGGFVTGAYAYASPDVTAGTPLYPIKQQMEKVEEKLQLTPEAKAKFYLKQMDRREAEAAVIKSRGQKLEQAENQIKQAEQNLQKAGDALDKIKSRDARLREEIKNKLERNWKTRKEQIESRMDKLQQKQLELEKADSANNLI